MLEYVVENKQQFEWDIRIIGKMMSIARCNLVIDMDCLN